MKTSLGLLMGPEVVGNSLAEAAEAPMAHSGKQFTGQGGRLHLVVWQTEVTLHNEVAPLGAPISLSAQARTRPVGYQSLPQ